jgi:hypothetical protein
MKHRAAVKAGLAERYPSEKRRIALSKKAEYRQLIEHLTAEKAEMKRLLAVQQELLGKFFANPTAQSRYLEQEWDKVGALTGSQLPKPGPCSGGRQPLLRE